MTRHQSETERRSQILRAAKTLFVQRGFRPTRVEDVAKLAGLSKGAVYFYFRSKRELFDALIDEEHAVTISFLEAAAEDDRPAAIKMVELARRYMDHFSELESPPRFFLLMSEMAIRDEEVRQRVIAIHDRFVDELAQLIEQGTREGTFDDVDPVAAAVMLKAFIDGVAGQAAIGVRPDVERLTTDGIRLVMYGLAAR